MTLQQQRDMVLTFSTKFCLCEGFLNIYQQVLRTEGDDGLTNVLSMSHIYQQVN